MNLRAHSYIIVLICLAVVVLSQGDFADLLALTPSQVAGLSAFILLGIASEAFAIDVAVGGNKATTSISFVALLSCALLFAPFAVVVSAMVMQVFADAIIQKRRALLVCFNAAQGIIATTVALYIYGVLGGGSIPSGDFGAGAFAGMVAALFTTNTLLVSGAVALRQGQRLGAVIQRVVSASSGNLLYGLLASPIAILMAVVYHRFYLGGMVLMLLPLLLVRYSYLSKAQLQKANRDLLKVLIKTIETRDPYTSGHSLRVSNLARLIAEDLGLSRRRIAQVETAGLLHDIGKIDMLYTSIIQKPSDLTEEELRIIKTHSVKGAEFLKSVTSLGDSVIEGVRHHHERFDGQGYPDGISGTEIPLYSRIIMISDAIDAMLSDRPYRPALTVDRVHDELLRCSGTQFDPEIIGVIIRSGTLIRAQELVRMEAATLEEEIVGAGSH